ncbi:MAG: DUF3822 family protein [Prevotella sp.]|nr:DUF3822 family protein [Prevotella sp.]
MNIIRISHTEIIVVSGEDKKIKSENHEVKSGVSVAANLRKVFESSKLLNQDEETVTVLIDSPVMLVPKDEFQEETAATLYYATFSGHETDKVMSATLNDLNCVAVFGINSDAGLVLGDHYKEVRLMPVMQPVCTQLFSSATPDSTTTSLYCFFHDENVDIFTFQHDRFKYFNTFSATHAHDALYFMLYVWKQLAFNPERDTMVVCGEIRNEAWLMESLSRYIRNIEYLEKEDPQLPYDINTITQLSQS